MHSNFITPPDYVETVLVLNATDEQLSELTQTVKELNRPYNIYFYNDSMNDCDWLDRIKARTDVILDAELNSPLEYFNK
jgi:hypothetical protein